MYLSIFGEFFFYQALIQKNESWSEEVSSLKVKSGPLIIFSKEIIMRRIFIAVVMLVSFSSLFANDMCENYARYMKGDDIYIVKVGECRRSLYAECIKYANGDEKVMKSCVDTLHYDNDLRVAGR